MTPTISISGEIARKCRACGKDIHEKLKGSGWVCSFKCVKATLRTKEKTCVFCKEKFLTINKTAKYCTRSCYVTSKGERLYKTCPVCGDEFTTRSNASTIPQRCCSHKCAGVNKSGEKSPRYRGTRIGSRGLTWKERQAQAQVRDGNRCLSLIHDPNFKPSRTDTCHIDHIVPYRAIKGWQYLGEILDPNDLRNLASLCLRCHVIKTMQVESYLVSGNITSFIDSLRGFYPLDVSEPSLCLYGLLDPNRLVVIAKDWTYERKPKAKRLPSIQGAKNYAAKLSESQVLDIIRRRDEPRKRLALEFGVTALYLGLIVRGLKWTYIERPYLADGKYPRAKTSYLQGEKR
jgi:hypothetical protein